MYISELKSAYEWNVISKTEMYNKASFFQNLVFRVFFLLESVNFKNYENSMTNIYEICKLSFFS